MMWVQVAPIPNAHAAGGGMATDLRNDLSRNPFVYQLVSAAILNRFNGITKGSQLAVNPGLGGTFGVGAGCTFCPSFALVGVLGTGSTTTSISTNTTLTSVGVNMLANRGGSGEYGYRVRISDNVVGGSGKIEERWITGNTSGTKPTLLLDTALTFTPGTGAAYEILSGEIHMLSAGTISATTFRAFEIATNTLTSLSSTGLAAAIGTDYAGCALDELYVPYDHQPGEGFVIGTSQYDGTSKYCLVATTSGPAMLTGQTSGGDIDVLANEYRNFQIRIVEDTAKPTAVNQRAIIASHTAGVSGTSTAPVYTLGANWTVTPSPTAKFVIEYPNQLLIRSSGTTSVYTYNYTNGTINNGTTSMNTNTWSTAYFGAAGSAMGAGCTALPSFGIEPDAAKNSRHSFVYFFRGLATTTCDVLDIAGGTTGSFSNAIVYDGALPTLTTGACGKYAPFDNEGRFGYLNIYVASAINQIYRFDVKNRVLQAFTPTDWIQSGTAAVGDRIGTYCAIDGTDKYTVIFLLAHLSTIAQELVVQV